MDTIEYLGFVVDPFGIHMDTTKTNAIRKWPIPHTVKEVQLFLGFANFYCQFIWEYAKIAIPLTQLTQKDQLFKWDKRAQKSFKDLKTAFVTAPILQHFNPSLHTILETDALDYAIALIISQYNEIEGIQPLGFRSHSMQEAELNYKIYDKELLAIWDAFREFQPYLEGSRYTVTVITDHKNLEYFTTTKVLSCRQA